MFGFSFQGFYRPKCHLEPYGCYDDTMFNDVQRDSSYPIVSGDLLHTFHYRPMQTYEPDFTDGCPIFDFEGVAGMMGWTYGGDAFRNQPTYKDTKFMREKIRFTGIEGDWWISTHEHRPSSAGQMRLEPLGYKGWALSPKFTLNVTKYTFLIGGEGPRVGIQLIVLRAVRLSIFFHPQIPYFLYLAPPSKPPSKSAALRI